MKNPDVERLRGEEHGLCIYMLESPDGGKYIGQTNNFVRRMQTYSGSMSWHKNQWKLADALKLYGFENFKVSILDDNVVSREKLNELEIYYISKFDSYNHGYNGTSGGESAINPNTGHGVRYMTGRFGISMVDDNAAWQRIRWASMTDEEKERVREMRKKRREMRKEYYNEKAREYRKKRLENMTDEEKERVREMRRKKYHANMTDAARLRINEKDRERIRNLDPEKKKQYLDRKRIAMNKRYAEMSTEKKKELLQQIKEKYANLSEEEKKALNQRHYELKKKRFAALSPEEQEEIKKIKLEKERKYRASRSPEWKEKKSKKAADNFYKRYNAMTEEEKRAFLDHRNELAKERRRKKRELLSESV